MVNSSIIWSNRAEKIRKIRPLCRAGIVPYCIVQTSIKLCMGIDRKTGELTDFGGGIKAHERVIDGAIREFYEESGTIFPRKFSDKTLTETTAIYKVGENKTFVLIFLPVPLSCLEEARKLEINYISDEISGIVWFTLNNKLPHKMWSEIKEIFQRIDIRNLASTLRRRYWYFH